jgi:hypothetical protein
MGTTLFSCADKMETNKKLMLLVKTLQSISNNCWHDVARKTMQNHVQPPAPANQGKSCKI